MVDERIKILDEPLDSQEVIDLVASPAAGAIDVFIGTVRNSTQNKSVQRLEFESYDSMAIKEISKIIEKASEKWPVIKMAVYHRKGILDIGDIAVVIAVSSPHRKAAFEACQFAIDTLKETVPIWKKEVFDDGEVWVAAHP
ncbi:MAG: molybdenum cofactor biosynthesis protein MoaE [Cyclobacteriaceae bacterium]|nr:molybdenum cofactor biosynthesis protein MoaE [Cyclobacteriaceae bacterium]